MTPAEAGALGVIERLLKLVAQTQERGERWEAGIQLALQATLVSPKFLFRVELDDRPDSPGPHPIDEYQLASRMSYFIWSSMPDQELFDLAARLGSDVPFCLVGGTAVGTGRGELVSQVLARGSYEWVLAYADGGLSTPEVFAEFSAAIRGHIGDQAHGLVVADFSSTGPVERASACPG